MKNAVLFMLLVVLRLPVRASDDTIEKLINGSPSLQAPEQKDDLPAALLLGDANAVQIYSASSYHGDPSPLCQPLEFDEIIEIQRGDPEAKETTINWTHPRVQKMMEDACLIRPGDALMAVGKGAQEFVVLDHFVIRKEAAICPTDSAFSLWGVLQVSLPERPLFYSSSPDLREIQNLYRPAETSSELLNEESFQKLKKFFPELAHFSVTVLPLEAPNADRLVRLVRTKLNAEDDQLPNEVVLSEKNGVFAVLVEERVDLGRGSGHIRWEGTLDYNDDGRLDVLLSGDQFKCPYWLFFEGTADGFVAVPVPNRPCSC